MPPSQIPACSIPAPGSSTQHVVFALRKVCRCWSVILTAPVAYGGFAELLAPSPVSAPTRRDCHGLVLTNPTPGPPGGASCRCASVPAWPSQLVRQGPSGSPSFRMRPSTRATLLDSGQPAPTSPVAVGPVLGCDISKSSPLASIPFEAELLKPDARPACGSRFSLGTLLDGRSSRRWPLGPPFLLPPSNPRSWDVG